MSEENVDKWTHYSNGAPVRAGDVCVLAGFQSTTNPVITWTYVIIRDDTIGGHRAVVFSEHGAGVSNERNGVLCVPPSPSVAVYKELVKVSHIDFPEVFKQAGITL